MSRQWSPTGLKITFGAGQLGRFSEGDRALENEVGGGGPPKLSVSARPVPRGRRAYGGGAPSGPGRLPPAGGEADELGMAVGKVIDAALGRLGFEGRQGRRPTVTSIHGFAEASLDSEILDAHLELSGEQRQSLLAQIDGVVRAYRSSELSGLTRPKSRLLLVDGRFGVYVQPDFWNGRDQIFEMKSYDAVPPPPDVAMQLQLFQLGFPGFRETLICFIRHALPVRVTRWDPPAPTPEETRGLLVRCAEVAKAQGTDKVLEYVDAPLVPYSTSG
jgi:hypothetical protein